MVGYRIQSRLEDNYYLHSWKCKRLRLRLEGAEGVRILHAITLLLPHLIQACRFLARCVSGTDGHVWKEITKTIHVYADKVPKKIGDAYVVLSSFSKMKQEVQWLIGLKGLALYKEWLGVFFICIKISLSDHPQIKDWLFFIYLMEWFSIHLSFKFFSGKYGKNRFAASADEQEVQWLIGLKGLALYKEWIGVFFICIKIPAFRSSIDISRQVIFCWTVK